MRLSVRIFVYRFVMAAVVVMVAGYLAFKGYSFYLTPIEERFYHPDYHTFGASGFWGHGLGIMGTLLIAIGVFGYIYAKKTLRFEKFIRLKYLLEFHIFLCTLGPLMVLFHTSFKFGGLVSIGFWSMTLVVLSGVVGRYIYVQIPRTLSGRALSFEEIESELNESLLEIKKITRAEGLAEYAVVGSTGVDRGEKTSSLREGIRAQIKAAGISPKLQKHALRVLKRMNRMQGRMKRLEKMQIWFSYWHIFHKPFAIIMLVIVLIHIVVTLMMGYTWVF